MNASMPREAGWDHRALRDAGFAGSARSFRLRGWLQTGTSPRNLRRWPHHWGRSWACRRWSRSASSIDGRRRHAGGLEWLCHAFPGHEALDDYVRREDGDEEHDECEPGEDDEHGRRRDSRAPRAASNSADQTSGTGTTLVADTAGVTSAGADGRPMLIRREAIQDLPPARSLRFAVVDIEAASKRPKGDFAVAHARGAASGA
jgi:hypothetical protein